MGQATGFDEEEQAQRPYITQTIYFNKIIMEQLIVLVWGLTQGLKQIGVPSKWLWLCAVMIGVLFRALPYHSSELLPQFIAEGAIIGLVASGIIGMVDGRIKKMNE